jgi:Zn-dependent M28 family amino/carboxypeptidase
MAGFDPGWIQILQLLPTAGLVVAAFALVDVALSGYVPGANDNASGVAAVLSAAEELDADAPANLDVWVVLTGAESCIAEGMRAFVRDPRAQLDRERTAVVNVTSVGSGPPRFEVSEGAFASIPLDRRLTELAAALADADDEKSGFGAEPVRTALVDDALPAIARKIPAITIRDGFLPPHHHLPSDTPENIDHDSLARATGFVVSLVRLLDREVGRDAG